MPKRSSKTPIDANKIAAAIVQQATEAASPLPEPVAKNPAAVALGKLGGLKGGPARARKLSRAKRVEIARKAALVRWQRGR